MLINEKFEWFIEFLKNNKPAEKTELKYETPFQLICAVILSAQCTDKRVNIVTPDLFNKYPDFFSMSLASFEDVFELIKSISFPNNKATNLIHMAKRLKTFYGGIVPKEVSELETLAGVGRKTANVVASVAFDVPAFGVDTHVIRLSGRLGFSMGSKNPLDIERVVTKNIPKELWASAHHWLVLHGRYVCTAANPKCEQCPITNICNENKANTSINNFYY